MAKKLAMVFGVIFVIVGLLGFFSNPLVGAHGYFMTDTFHNVVHLLIGIIMLAMAGSAAGTSLTVFGIIYLLLAIVGFVQGGSGKLLGLVAYNAADNWLHLVVGVVLLAAGFSGKKAPAVSTMSTPQV